MVFLIILPIVALVLFATAITVNRFVFSPPKINEEFTDGRKVTFKSGKNRLTGYVWNETGSCGLVVIAHGMGTSVGYHLPEIRRFADKGYKVFSFEYSGYGESKGHFNGFPQAVYDLKNAVEFIDDGSLPLILFGHSMGGYAVCAVSEYLSRHVGAIVAYAPFYSSAEAIAETTKAIPKFGRLIKWLITPVQYVLFGSRHRLNGVDGLRAANAPALVLQGSGDEEVRRDGCSMYAHAAELPENTAIFRLIEAEDSCGHITLIRKKGTQYVNEDTIKIVDAFLNESVKKI